MYWGNNKLLHGLYNVHKMCKKKVFLIIDGAIKPFNILQILPDLDSVQDHELTPLHKSIEQLKSQNMPQGIHITETLEAGDPRSRYPQLDAAKVKELESPRKRGVFEIVMKDNVPDDTNILGARFVLSIKNKNTTEEVYKAR